jgi:SAM-dependent methyltransferase
VSATLYGPAFFEGRSHTVSQSAGAVVPHLMQLLEPKSVLDVGCGQGEWLDAFPLADKIGVDIAAPDRKNFAQLDLTEPFWIGKFDLVLCLEVGEHLPEESADTLVESIVKHAGDVVFGAAVPGQEGKGHINCQPHEYWHDKFAERNFHMFDDVRPLIQDDARVSPWYRNNIFIYRQATSGPLL